VIKIGKRTTIIAAILMALCVAPIMLYAVFGPEDGNPIGLGLFMAFGTPVFGGAILIGAIIWVVGSVRGKRDRSPEKQSRPD
jgi:hypothetical protein